MFYSHHRHNFQVDGDAQHLFNELPKPVPHIGDKRLKAQYLYWLICDKRQIFKWISSLCMSHSGECEKNDAVNVAHTIVYFGQIAIHVTPPSLYVTQRRMWKNDAGHVVHTAVHVTQMAIIVTLRSLCAAQRRIKQKTKGALNAANQFI